MFFFRCTHQPLPIHMLQFQLGNYLINESITISFFNRLARDIELMTGSKPSLYWMICWKYISPFVMTIILLASFIQLIVNGAGYDAWISELGETKVKPWPWWAIIMIIFLIGISVLWIPIVALLRYECRNDFILFFVLSFSY